MAFTVDLIEGSEPAIGLFYLADDGWSMRDSGFEPNDPERRELWGGYLETILVRQEDGKRQIPLRFYGDWGSADAVIDAINALEARLRHAARYRTGGWGDEVFLRFQLHNSTYGVDFPVCSGMISKADVLNVCNAPMDGTGHRELTRANSIGVTLVCEPYWEATTTYTLENYIDNPGFWRGAVAPGDSWTEVDPAAALTLAWSTGTRYVDWQVMGRALEMTQAPDGVNDIGIQSDAQPVVAGQDYVVQVRHRRTSVSADQMVLRVWDATGAALISDFAFTPGADWATETQTFTAPGGCASAWVGVFRTAAASSAGNKVVLVDAIYMDDGTTAPTGWSSGRNLTNELDAADQINVVCLTEIPGEVEAETRIDMTVGAITYEMWAAKRTRDQPHGFIWELLAADAYCAVDGIFGLVDGTTADSTKAANVNAPGGHDITVSFAGTPGWARRCAWRIGEPATLAYDLADYYGRFILVVLCKASGTTDEIRMNITSSLNGDFVNHVTDGEKELIVPTVGVAVQWELLNGWNVIAWPIGTHDDDLWDIGNYWEIAIRAVTDGGGTPTDSLVVAGAYLISTDEQFLISNAGGAPATTLVSLKNMDGDRGTFRYVSPTNRYYSNQGAVGSYPLLSPKIENYLYFIGTSTTNEIDITDSYVVAVTYRPRGVFLRGSDPG